MSQSDFFNYLPINPSDEKWGIVCTTAGFQNVNPHSHYPLSIHPVDYSTISKGRTLEEYQLVYIIKGEGTFNSHSGKKVRITAGTIILLFPKEWHLYHPDPKIGWSELWVGFKGINMDKRVENGFFSKESPTFNIGISLTIINQYHEIFKIIKSQKSGFQQLVTGMILNILGNIYYKNQNKNVLSNPKIEKIQHAIQIMKEHAEKDIPPKSIAESLNISYSWFRKMFKEYTGLSPNQYLLQAKLIRSKELLVSSMLSVSDIAYQLGFESISQFSAFFKQKEGINPSSFRKLNSFIHP